MSASPSTSVATDIEAQNTLTGRHSPLPTPMRIIAHVCRAPATQFTTDPVDDFFGYKLSSMCTHDSRHDRRVSDTLPPYTDDLPPYMKAAEPVTLAKYLFKFGFLFPPFWIMGAIILISPLRAPAPTPTSAWLPEKTASERQQIIAEMRTTELKWALRCLWALIGLVVLCAIIAVVIWGINHS